VQGLEARGSAPRELNASGRPGARLFVVREDGGRPGSLPEGVVAAHEHCVTSDVTRALATGATAFPRSHFPFDRAEGRFLASADVGGKWFGIAKAVLTTCISPGRDAVVEGVPREVCEVLQLTCRHLAVVCPPLTCST
jgi:hypothetical protein